MTNVFKLRPPLEQLQTDFYFGDSRGQKEDLLLIGTVGEEGTKRNVWYDVSDEHVLLIVGKRGSGKSYSMGVLLEGLGISNREKSRIARLAEPRGIVLFDTLGIFWSMIHLVERAGSARHKEQWKNLTAANLGPEPVNVIIWIPAGSKMLGDHETFREFRINVSDLTLDDWSSILDVDLVGSQVGQLLSTCFVKVTLRGWQKGTARVHPVESYTIGNLIECLDGDQEIQTRYAGGTVDALRRRLSYYDGLPVMGDEGTPIIEIVQSGVVSIIELSLNRMEEDLRNAVVSILLRKVMTARAEGSYSKKVLELQPGIPDVKRKELETALAKSIPRVWIALDEVHNFAPATGRTLATKELIRTIKEGRNIGISIVMTTQQPSGLAQEILTQVDTLVVHQLTEYKDRRVAFENRKSPYPSEVRVNGKVLPDLEDLPAFLGIGEALLSCSEVTPDISRAFVLRVRPRVTAHGGYAG